MERQLRVAPSMMGQFGNGSVDQSLRLTTFGMFGATASFVPSDFIWDAPWDAKDRAEGGVCSATGYRGPGHAMVRVDGQLFQRDFAPERVVK